MKYLFFISLLLLAGCSTPAGRAAKQDAATIGKSVATAQKATQDAKDTNASVSADLSNVQSLDSRIDAKDAVLSNAKIIP